jgi:hypothetical protein
MKKSQKSDTNRNKTSIDDIIADYRDLIKEYSLPTDDELVRKLQRLNTTERDLMILYVACDRRAGIFARILGTNIKYGKNLIENIRTKIINME